MAVMRCYKLNSSSIEHIQQEKYLNNYDCLPSNFGKYPKERLVVWNKIKGELEHNINCKQVDDIIYKGFKNSFIDQPEFTIFAIGTGKRLTLEKIYLKEEEELKKHEEIKWDLSDESISINEHIKAIHEKKEVKNEFTAKQSDQLLYKLVNNNVAKCVNNKDWNGLIRALVFNLKSLKEVFKYSKYDSLSIIQLLRDLQTQIEDSKFLDRLKKSKDLPYFDGSILFNIDNL